MVALGVCRQGLFCSALRLADVFWVEMHKSDIKKKERQSIKLVWESSALMCIPEQAVKAKGHLGTNWDLHSCLPQLPSRWKLCLAFCGWMHPAAFLFFPQCSFPLYINPLCISLALLITKGDSSRVYWELSAITLCPAAEPACPGAAVPAPDPADSSRRKSNVANPHTVSTDSSQLTWFSVHFENKTASVSGVFCNYF